MISFLLGGRRAWARCPTRTKTTTKGERRKNTHTQTKGGDTIKSRTAAPAAQNAYFVAVRKKAGGAEDERTGRGFFSGPLIVRSVARSIIQNRNFVQFREEASFEDRVRGSIMRGALKSMLYITKYGLQSYFDLFNVYLEMMNDADSLSFARLRMALNSQLKSMNIELSKCSPSSAGLWYDVENSAVRFKSLDTWCGATRDEWAELYESANME